MKFIKQLERYQKLDDLIKQEKTGTPNDLAEKLELSRSHLYRLLGDLKDYGAEIKYCRKMNTFQYKNLLIL
jgi:predicted transcriptional regulator